MYFYFILFLCFMQGFNVNEALQQEDIDKLKETFNKLDSDSAG